MAPCHVWSVSYVIKKFRGTLFSFFLFLWLSTVCLISIVNINLVPTHFYSQISTDKTNTINLCNRVHVWIYTYSCMCSILLILEKFARLVSTAKYHSLSYSHRCLCYMTIKALTTAISLWISNIFQKKKNPSFEDLLSNNSLSVKQLHREIFLFMWQALLLLGFEADETDKVSLFHCITM